MDEDATRGQADRKGLEGVVKRLSQRYTDLEKCGQVIKGVAVPLLGAAVGFYATRGIGGAGLGMYLTSLGMASLDRNDPRGYETSCYRIGYVVGSVAVVMGGIKYLFIDH